MKFRCCSLAGLLVLNLSAPVRADTLYWDGSGTSWADAAAWSTATGDATPDPLSAPGTSDVASFNITGVNAAQTVSLNGPQSALGLLFDSTGSVAFQGGGTNRTLTLGSSGITVNAGAGAVTIGSATANQNVGVLLGANQTWTNNSSLGLTVTNTLSNAGNATPFTLTLAGSSFFNLNGVISNGGATGTTALVFDAAGSSNIGSATANTYSGGTTILRGSVLINASAVAAFGTGAVTLGATSGSNSVLLRARSISNAIVLASGTTGNLTIDTVGASTATLSGGVTGTNNLRVMATNGGTLTFNTAAINHTGTLTSVSSGTGAGSVVISSAIGSNVTGVTVNNTNAAAKLVLGSASNAYTGDTTITAGILQLGAANVITDGAGKGNVIVNGTLDMNTFSEGINGLSGSGTVDKSAAGSATLTVGGNNATSTFSGTIKNTAGTLGLTKTGTGTLTLSGTNSYSGTTTVNSGGGILAITQASSLGSGAVSMVKIGVLTGTLQLQLTGSNSLANNFTFSSATGFGGGGSAHIQNVSGTNTLTGTMTLTATGGNGINIQSDAGLLTLAGNVSSTVADSTRQLGLHGAGNGVVSGNIVDGGTNLFSVVKSGNGTWTLSGANTYGGSTSINGGTLLVSGSLSKTSAVNVAAGATLGGSNGSINNAATTTVNGTLAPGSSIGSLTTGAVVFNTGSHFGYELNSAGLTGDLLNVNGALTLNGNVSLDLTDLAAAALENGKLTLISYSGLWNGGTYSGYADDSEFDLGDTRWLINYNDTAGGTNGGIHANFVTLTVVPEPAAALLGSLGILLICRRRRS